MKMWPFASCRPTSIPITTPSRISASGILRRWLDYLPRPCCYARRRAWSSWGTWPSTGPRSRPTPASTRRLREYLRLDDTIFTLKLTPNLGHCLSVYGVAREVAALTGAPLKARPSRQVEANDDALLRVSVEAPDLCGRFSGRVVRHIDPQAKTPAWMADRLARCGQRTVAPVVDSANYGMFESGQPSHIFDLDAIEGGLQVRWGRPGESLELLNGSTVELDAMVGVIADDVRVESLAGIK